MTALHKLQAMTGDELIDIVRTLELQNMGLKKQIRRIGAISRESNVGNIDI